MNRLLKYKTILLGGLFSDLVIEENDYDKYKKASGLFIEDPWERLKTIFLKDDMGNYHPELMYTIEMTQLGGFTGAVYGGIKETIHDTENFIRTNDTNIYAHKRDVYKLLVNKNILAFAKGAWKWAPVFAIFFGGFTFISSCCELYRNKSGVIENTVAGFSVGALCKSTFGIKGMISGGIVGGVLGTIYGIVIWGTVKLTNEERRKFKYAQFAFMKYREEWKNHNLKKNKEDESLGTFQSTIINSKHVVDPLDNFSTEKILSSETGSSSNDSDGKRGSESKAEKYDE